LLAHTLYLGRRAVIVDGAPLSSAFDWYLLAAWAMMVVYLFLIWYHPRTSIGLFLLPLVLGLIGLAKFADRTPFPTSSAGQVWGAIHGVFLLLGLVAVALGFVAGVMYLIQSYRLKHKMPSASGVRLPSLEWLERVSSRAILVSVLMVGIGFASGIVLNMILQQRKLDEVPWSDPVIWRTALMFGWLLVAAVFSAIYRPARSGRKVAYLTVANFVFLAVSLGIGVLLPSEHGAAERQKTGIEGGIRNSEGGRVEFQCGLQIADSRMQIDWLSNAALKLRCSDDFSFCTLHSAFFIPLSNSALRLSPSAFAPPEAQA
jgi:ABC-type uncharacterized transport system permease subunit